MQISDIRDDDPELQNILRSLNKPSYSLKEVAELGPAKIAQLYKEMNAGRLLTGYSGQYRFVLAPDFAKWLLLMKRESEEKVKSNSEKMRNRWQKARAAKGQEAAA